MPSVRRLLAVSVALLVATMATARADTAPRFVQIGQINHHYYSLTNQTKHYRLMAWVASEGRPLLPGQHFAMERLGLSAGSTLTLTYPTESYALRQAELAAEWKELKRKADLADEVLEQCKDDLIEKLSDDKVTAATKAEAAACAAVVLADAKLARDIEEVTRLFVDNERVYEGSERHTGLYADQFEPVPILPEIRSARTVSRVVSLEGGTLLWRPAPSEAFGPKANNAPLHVEGSVMISPELRLGHTELFSHLRATVGEEWFSARLDADGASVGAAWVPGATADTLALASTEKVAMNVRQTTAGLELRTLIGVVPWVGLGGGLVLQRSGWISFSDDVAYLDEAAGDLAIDGAAAKEAVGPASAWSPATRWYGSATLGFSLNPDDARVLGVPDRTLSGFFVGLRYRVSAMDLAPTARYAIFDTDGSPLAITGVPPMFHTIRLCFGVQL